ncbi:MAG: hypothetical protein M1549_03185 [Candidatus Dependentiae bacterium]|nr:hypothetical protein [Candidatus Dependentiae bacterium]
MKTHAGKILFFVLATAFAITSMRMEASSSSVLALCGIRPATFFTQVSRCFSTLYSRFLGSVPQDGMKQFSAAVPLLAKPSSSDKPKREKAPTDQNASHFELKPKTGAELNYVKTADFYDRERTKEFFEGGALNPTSVALKIKEMIDGVRKGPRGKWPLEKRLHLSAESVGLIIEVAEALFGVKVIMKLMFANNADGKVVGYRHFGLRFGEIEEKNGESAEVAIMSPGTFDIDLAYRQKGLGTYLFLVQNALLKSYKNAIGIIEPSPYFLTAADEIKEGKMLSILRAYYATFGFIPHPIWPRQMVIFFKNGVEDPVMNILDVLSKGDAEGMAKLLSEQSAALERKLPYTAEIGGGTLLEIMLIYTISRKKEKLLRVLLDYGNTVDKQRCNRKCVAFALDVALLSRHPQIIQLLITKYGALDTLSAATDLSRLLDKATQNGYIRYGYAEVLEFTIREVGHRFTQSQVEQLWNAALNTETSAQVRNVMSLLIGVCKAFDNPANVDKATKAPIIDSSPETRELLERTLAEHKLTTKIKQ